MSVGRGLQWEVLNDPLILVTYYDGEGQHTHWDAYLTMVKDIVAKGDPRFLIYTLEPPPRSAIDSLLSVTRGGRWRTALVSPSLAVRFIASTFSLAVRNLRYFQVDALPAALEHLECIPQEKQAVYGALRRLSGDRPRVAL